VPQPAIERVIAAAADEHVPARAARQRVVASPWVLTETGEGPGEGFEAKPGCVAWSSSTIKKVDA
jgi:hypothetical protein